MTDQTFPSSPKPIFKRPVAYLPLLLGPAAIVGVVLYHHWLGDAFPDSPADRKTQLDSLLTLLDGMGPWILAAAVAFYWAKAMLTRNRTYTVLLGVAVCLLLRELHWSETIKDVIYPLLGLCLLWAILWRDVNEAKKAAAAFKPDARHCLELGVVDAIVPEPAGGAHANLEEAARLLGEGLSGALAEVEGIDPHDRIRRRRAKFRAMGVYAE